MIVVRPNHPDLARHDVMGLATDAELAAVAAVGSAAIPLAQRGAANGVATLGADAKIPGSQLPALAIGETFTVASQAAMLALVAQRGDVAVRTDLDPDGFFLLTTDSPGTLADWVQITAPGAVLSVNTRTGAVTGLAEEAATTAALAGKQATIPAGTFAPPVGNNTIIIGDSIAIDGSNTISGNRSAADWFAWAHLISRGRIGYQRNAGTQGEGSAQVLARLAADVIAYAPQMCIISIGTNDMAAVSLTTYSANIKAMVAALQAAGIQPVLTTILPRNDASGIALRGTLETWNAWLRRYSLSQRLRLIDFDPVMSDGLGGMIAAFTTDGLHPIEAGARVMGQRAADVLSNILPPLTVPLARHQGAATKNLLAGGLFLVDTNADGLADGWSAIGTMTPSRDTGDTDISGNWQRITSSSTAGYSGCSQAVASGWSVGDRMAFCGRVEWDIAAGGGGALLQVIMANGTPNTFNPVNVWSAGPQSGGVFYGEFDITAGTTALTVYLYRTTTVSGTGGWARMAQMTLLNLTTLGALL